MNDLYKTKKVLLGLNKHPSYSCKSCPYNDVEDCTSHLMEDAFDVIAAQKEMLNRKEMAKDKLGFITLTNGILYSSDGQSIIMTDNGKIAVRIDDILSVRDLGEAGGSEIRLKNAQQTTLYVCETLEEILGKVADVTGGEE